MGQCQRGTDQVSYIFLHKTMLLFTKGFNGQICKICKICRLKCSFGSNLHNIQIAYRASVYVDRREIIL
jgi:hypothetical protein